MGKTKTIKEKALARPPTWSGVGFSDLYITLDVYVYGLFHGLLLTYLWCFLFYRTGIITVWLSVELIMCHMQMNTVGRDHKSWIHKWIINVIIIFSFSHTASYAYYKYKVNNNRSHLPSTYYVLPTLETLCLIPWKPHSSVWERCMHCPIPHIWKGRKYSHMFNIIHLE